MMTVLFMVIYTVIYSKSVDKQQNEIIMACEAIRDRYVVASDNPIPVLRNSMYSMASTFNTRFFVVNTKGTTIVCTDAYPCVHVYSDIPQSILESALSEGIYTEVGRLNDLYAATFFSCAVPVIKNDGECIGYVFASKNMNAFDTISSELLNIFIVTFVIASLFAFFVVYIVTFRITRPVRKLTAAAHQLAEGDFSARVEKVGHDEISELSETFNRMADSLESLERMRSSFVANVSHELKTPMTTIGGFIDGILDGTIPSEQRNHYLEIVSSETKRLSRLVKTLLYLSKIEAGEETAVFSQFNYADVITEVIISLEPRLSEKNMNVEGLDWDNVIMTNADRDMIYQVTYNIVENAIKYSPENGSIGFSFEKKGGKHCISVTNTCSGISEEDQKHIFDRFYKVDKSRGLDGKSTGIGLYLVATLLKINDQSIFVESDGSSYVTFTFTLDAV